MLRHFEEINLLQAMEFVVNHNVLPTTNRLILASKHRDKIIFHTQAVTLPKTVGCIKKKLVVLKKSKSCMFDLLRL
jgi:hypothetical protein